MNKFILRFSLLGLLVVAVAGTPVASRAQDTNAPAAPKKSSRHIIPFHGKVKAIDNTAKTISVGTETIQITSETRIMKLGKPATLEDGTVGEDVAGAFRKDAEGNLNAISVRFGPKPPVAVPNSKTNSP
jgi:hypothetical protein